MGKIYSFWESWLIPQIMRFHDNRYLAAIRHTFYILLPFWLTISFFDILGNVFLNPSGIILHKDGLNLGMFLTGLSGEEYLQSNFAQTLGGYKKIVDVSYKMISLVIVAILSEQLSKFWNSDRYITIFCSLAAYMFISVPTLDKEKITSDYFLDSGFFLAFFVAFLSARIFSWLYNIKKLRIKIPKSMPKRLKHYLSAVISILLTLLIFSFLSIFFEFIRLSSQEFLAELATGSIFQNPVFVLFYQFVVWSLWWLGIPGYSVTSAIQEVAYTPAQIGNQIGDMSAIFTTGFFEAGVIHVLGLMIAILVFSQHEEWRQVSKFSMPFMAINIQEVFLFGLPVVLNPIFLLPYVFAPMANTFVGWIAISWGIIPIFQVDLPWTMPLFISATLGTHSIMGGILQIVWLIMDIFIYAPFVITANSIEFKSERKDGEDS